jgi:hypothetical protein
VLLAIGLALTFANAVFLIWRCLRPRPARPYPAYGWVALAAFALLEILLGARVHVVAQNFTPLIWTAYIFVVDAAVYRVRGTSAAHSAARFAAVWLISVPAWLVFESYNLRLKNWAYFGVTDNYWTGLVTGIWAFATIYPGIFETAELIYWTGSQPANIDARRVRLGFSAGTRVFFIVVGVALLAIPLLARQRVAPYLFALVWAGFIYLLDPINHWLRQPSLLGRIAAGEWRWVWSLLLSGYICGFFWEFWNYWAIARWEYIFPILQRSKMFAMPLPGYIGFPPFALECFTMSVFISWLFLPRSLRPSWPSTQSDER